MYALSLATQGKLGCPDGQPLALSTRGKLCPQIEIIDVDTGGPGDGDEIRRRRRLREEQEVIDVAIALIVSGVLDELI